MDSKDKMLNDFRKKIGDLERTVIQKDVEILAKSRIISDLQRNEAGTNAVRNSLQAERELTTQLNGQIETYKQSVLGLKEANDNLRALNLTLQTELATMKSGNSEAVISEHQKTEL